MTFVARHALWSDEQRDAAQRMRRIAEEKNLEVIRLAFPDQHGILRGKTIVASEAIASLESGCSITTTMLAKDTSHRTVFPVFTAGGGFGMKEMEGAADVLMVPDPTTFRVLPWAPTTGWVLCDLYFNDGRPVPFATRGLYKRVLGELGTRGHDFVAGLEVEFHIFRLDDPHMRAEDAGQPGTPPSVSLLSHGYQYLTEQRFDQMEPVLEILRRDIVALGLPLRSVEVEFGPSQCEFTFQPKKGVEPADNMVLFRSAVKQIARRHGYHATFMCRPKLPNVFASGWHLHQSIVSRASGDNLFMAQEAAKDGGEPLSAFGKSYLAGLLDHARASTLFTTPTINGYKRYRSYSLAPDRAIWGRDNRGVMIRVLGGAGDASTRLENRIGEPAANPYLYMASQILSGLDGVDRKLDPGPSADTPYETKAPPLPKSLRDAVSALKDDPFFREKLGAEFVDYYTHIKNAEIDRFLSEVTDWEHREYFEVF
ncbi:MULTISPECIES: glutamine synthetase family protein [Bradyrhizobium]|uniref:glutamine synthetase family protein n=1 Tax=Bradyrhizobium TaxID=374 RepID=UPI00155EBFBB|nr:MULTISPECIES: glutamine synthetase family protein [Bradyrhizobium]MDD1519482.1 glutamine synthetase [Bradyrhizobium sp. WBAH30]MDD1543726.1 glutamine synthetase [Bradyrhizobium sp. WBAH41]MDD1557989.1 glutamine synthetase [Bradyrhizobium sp. WBAH23]MDD1565401.1 glutamine synthetase [Bradyrhizobium sp. WBAH33]MDD1592777.1 glutamine synthetase [Bradyrhizobium sp. WBAH42]